jgi:hypothetical protein
LSLQAQLELISSPKYKATIQYFFISIWPVLGYIMDNYEVTIRDFELAIQIKYIITISVLGLLSLMGVQIITYIVKRRNISTLISLRNSLSLFPLEVITNRLTFSLVKAVSQ